MTVALRAEGAARGSVALERRAFARLPARGAAVCRPGNQPFHPGLRAVLVDISLDGVGLRAPKAFAAGALIELELDPVGSGKLVRLAEVRWVKELPDGSYRLGCCGEHRLSFAEMQMLI
jgi:hypothetical protein